MPSLLAWTSKTTGHGTSEPISRVNSCVAELGATGRGRCRRLNTISGIRISLPLYDVGVFVVRGFPLDAGFCFQPCLFQAGAGDYFRELFGAEVVVEFAKYPDAAVGCLAVAASLSAVGHDEQIGRAHV